MQEAAAESTYSVYDGDTITEHVVGSKPFGHRLAKVDAPEKAQDFGKEAKAFTEKLCLGKFIKFVATDKSSYTRPVEHIICDGVELNAALVKAGYAWVDPRYANVKDDKHLYDLQAAAKALKLGIWSSRSTPIPPWLWRVAVKARGACLVYEKNVFKVVKGVVYDCKSEGL